MHLRPLIPPGAPTTPERLYSELALGDRSRPDRPYVVCNFVSSADGKATAEGRTASLGGEGDRAVFHLLRTQVDAILAGTGTLRVERYGPLVRSEAMIEIRHREGRPSQPLAVIISRTGRIPFEIPLFADPASRVAIYAPSDTIAPPCPAEVKTHPLAAAEGALTAVLRSLHQEYDVHSLLCEGGPILFNAMLAEDLVDELFLTVAPVLVGGAELGITAGRSLPALTQLRLEWVLELDGHLFLRYAR
jgi:riboflavin-specific deaminase-like protein